MSGDSETGVTTFFLQKKVDTGNVIMQRSMSISENETAGEVHDRMMLLGADVVVETVKQILNESVTPYAQDDSMASGAPKIFRDDCQIDFSMNAAHVHNQIRGLSPSPGAFSFLDGNQIKIFRTRRTLGTGEPGEVVKADESLVIACREGALEVVELQQAGKQRMKVADFLRGSRVNVGQKFQSN